MTRLLLTAAVALAATVCRTPVAYSFCWEEASEYSGLPVELLRAIVQVESGGDPYALNWNPNGSYDYGLTQINSSWYRTLGRDRWEALTQDACYNLKIGAWVLRQCLDKLGYTWRGLGCYNATTDRKRARYARKVIPVLQQTLATSQGATE
jgi:soluble lytic murein transglycosylase-like protein